jgi:hypothetical protein
MDDAQWMAGWLVQTQGVRLRARPVGNGESIQGQAQLGAQCCILKDVPKHSAISLFFGGFYNSHIILTRIVSQFRFLFKIEIRQVQLDW